jgi:hypothetical protein
MLSVTAVCYVFSTVSITLQRRRGQPLQGTVCFSKLTIPDLIRQTIAKRSCTAMRAQYGVILWEVSLPIVRVPLSSMGNGSCAKGIGLRPEPGNRDLHPAWIRPRNLGKHVHSALTTPSAISRCTTATKDGTYIMKGVVNVALHRSSLCRVWSIEYRLQHTAAYNAREFITLPKITPTVSQTRSPKPFHPVFRF